MDSLLKFILTSGNQITVVGLLTAELVFGVIALYREWFVLGKPYRACMQRVEAFEKAATTRADVNEAKVAELEARIRELLDEREERRRP
jgi:hypothetical protein